jgi:hypothetical protein
MQNLTEYILETILSRELRAFGGRGCYTPTCEPLSFSNDGDLTLFWGLLKRFRASLVLEDTQPFWK